MADEASPAGQDILALKASAEVIMGAASAQMREQSQALWDAFEQGLSPSNTLWALAGFERAVQRLFTTSAPTVARQARELVYAAARAGAADAQGSWNGLIHEGAVWAPGFDLGERITAMFASDAASAIRRARTLVQLYTHATWAGKDHAAALKAAQGQLDGAELGDAFKQLDSLGRAFASATALSALVRHAMRQAYAERFFTELVGAGQSGFVYVHPERGAIAMELPQWLLMQASQIHPNARWRLKR